ncbi:MAG TPA: TIGR04222 domain-containing membrane protein [Candidatus Melainabacteria bacterium]|nr:TIGR04222 domain-containing membrane protein [Candidatus Melainabacteria bacterium]
MAADAHGRTWTEVLGRKGRYKDIFERMRVRLMKKGLIADKGCESLCRLLTVVAALIPPLVLGLPRIVETFSTHRPVFFLVLLVLISFVHAIISCYQGAVRTGAGNKFLSDLKDQNRGLYTTASSGSSNVGANDMVLALAVFGTTLIMAPGFFMFKDYFIPPVSSSSSGSCSSCSSCGGGCGGGCGGCGG